MRQTKISSHSVYVPVRFQRKHVNVVKCTRRSHYNLVMLINVINATSMYSICRFIGFSFFPSVGSMSQLIQCLQ